MFPEIPRLLRMPGFVLKLGSNFREGVRVFIGVSRGGVWGRKSMRTRWSKLPFSKPLFSFSPMASCSEMFITSVWGLDILPFNCFEAETEAILAQESQLYDDVEAQMEADIKFFDATKEACQAKHEELVAKNAEIKRTTQI